MQKVINAHCHIYPPKIAKRAVEGIGKFYDLHMSLNGMVDDMIRDGEKINTTHYLVHSVATKPSQVESINEFIASEVVRRPGLLTGFGAMHPLSDNMEEDMDKLLSLGLKGVKLHPDFQGFSLDSEEAIRLGHIISDAKVPVLIHCGDYRYNYSNPDQLKKFLDALPDLTVIGAHFAGWSVWEEASIELSGRDNLFVDTSSSLAFVDEIKAKEIIDRYGATRCLWGTDYPMWSSKAEMERFLRIDLTDEERNLILYENAAKLLHIDEYSE